MVYPSYVLNQHDPGSTLVYNSLALSFKADQLLLLLLLFVTATSDLPWWLSSLRHSVQRPGRSFGGAGVQFPGSAGRFRLRILGAHALRLISWAGKEGSTASSIICDCWLILS